MKITRIFGKGLISLMVMLVSVNVYGAETALTSDNCTHSNPRWSPDGNWIVYGKTCGGGFTQIYKISSSGGSEIALTSDDTGKGSPSWSPGSDWVVYLRRDSTTYWQVYKIPSGGGSQVALTSSVTWFGDLKGRPEWSPDGNWIAFLNRDATEYDQIYKVTHSGTSETALTSNSYDHGYPHWTPDSQYIYYPRGDSSGFTHIYKISVGGGGEIKITTQNNNHGWIDLSNDGSFFVFIGPESNQQLSRVSSGGGEENLIINSSKNIYKPQISPNDQYACYYRQQDSTTYYNIYVVRLSDGSEIPITSDVYNHYNPRWSSDGTQTVYEKIDTTGYRQIYVSDFNPPPDGIPTLSDAMLVLLGAIFLLLIFYRLRGGMKNEKEFSEG